MQAATACLVKSHFDAYSVQVKHHRVLAAAAVLQRYAQHQLA
jgi:hypothetical protein